MTNEALKALFIRMQKQEDEAFKNFYNQYYQTLFAIIFPILKNEHDCQDVISLILYKLATISPDKLPQDYEKTWLYTVAKNEALQYLRKQKQHVSLDELPETITQLATIDTPFKRQDFDLMLSSLSDKQQKIITLKLLGELTHKEIAELMQLPVGTVQWTYHAALAKLKAVTYLALLGTFGSVATLEYIRYKTENSFGVATVTPNPTLTYGLGFILIISLLVLVLNRHRLLIKYHFFKK